MRFSHPFARIISTRRSEDGLTVTLSVDVKAWAEDAINGGESFRLIRNPHTREMIERLREQRAAKTNE